MAHDETQTVASSNSCSSSSTTTRRSAATLEISHAWAIHGEIAIDGEILMAEFDTYDEHEERARRVRRSTHPTSDLLDDKLLAVEFTAPAWLQLPIQRSRATCAPGKES